MLRAGSSCQLAACIAVTPTGLPRCSLESSVARARLWTALVTTVCEGHPSSVQVSLSLRTSALLSLNDCRMGADEDAFLLSVHEQFGGVVYLPWPLCQFLVTDKALVETVYNTHSKSLAFVSPFSVASSASVVGSSHPTSSILFSFC